MKGFRGTVCLLAKAAGAKPQKGGGNATGTGLKPAEEDKLFALMEHYADGSNHLTKRLRPQEAARLRRGSQAYDRLKELSFIATQTQEDAHERSQQRALRVLPEVLRAAACRPTSTTWPINFRRPTMTPPAPDYTPPAVEGVSLYEVPTSVVQVMHNGLPAGEDALVDDKMFNINADDSPISLHEEELLEEARMKTLRDSYLWWREQQQYGPRAETVQRDFDQMKHEQEVKLYTVRRAKHGKNDYLRKRQFMVAPVLRDDTKEGVMYKRVKK